MGLRQRPERAAASESYSAASAVGAVGGTIEI